MSKREIPQPVWPDITVFVKGERHCLTPIVGRDGSVTYEKGKLGKAADAIITEVVKAAALRNGKDGEVIR